MAAAKQPPSADEPHAADYVAGAVAPAANTPPANNAGAVPKQRSDHSPPSSGAPCGAPPGMVTIKFLSGSPISNDLLESSLIRFLAHDIVYSQSCAINVGLDSKWNIC